jgi:hypothetical protein
MEGIGGFMRSHRYAPSVVCSRRIGPADAMVIAVAVGLNTTQTQLLASVYRTFLLAKVVTFETRNGPSTHVIDATSFVNTCQQEKKGGSHQLHF